MRESVRLNRSELLKRRENAGIDKPAVTCFYMNSYLENIDEIPVLREARALKNFWENVQLQLFPDEIIAGRLIFREPVMFHYSCGTYIDTKLAEKWVRQEHIDDGKRAEFINGIEKIDQRRYKTYDRGIFTEEERASIDAVAATSTFFGGHMVMNYEYILSKGLDGIKEDILYYLKRARPEQTAFYTAMETVLEGIKNLILRYSQKANSIPGSSSSMEAARMNNLHKNLLHIAGKPPVSFEQALQLVWFIHIVSDCDSFGRFDQYLYPYFKQDIDSGMIDMDKATELLEGFFIKVEEAGQIQNMTIGGADTAFAPGYNELTALSLKAVHELGFPSPNLCLRVKNEMNDELWNMVMDSLESGQGLPALYNDNVIEKALTASGIPQEHARNYCLAGCSQVIIPGMSNFVNDIGIINVAKCLELTYLNGYDPFTGKNTGLKTGSAEQFSSFNQFLEAFKKQLTYFCRLEAEINNKDIDYRRKHEGYAVRTLFTFDCLEKGMGVYDGGARYNNVQLECIGITNAADSLMAIKKAVFEDKTITFPELVNILKSNFEGQEPFRRYLANSIPKFGNNVEEVDEIRRDITEFIYQEMRKQKGIAGGVYVPGEVIFTAHEWHGNAVGATPDGRYAKTVLADSAGASQGMDKKGPTALMNSVLHIPSEGILTSIVLNVKFMKQLWKDRSAAVNMPSLFKSFFERGGMQVQINVCDNKTLLDALENPDKYNSLIVRVGGYSAYFNSLSRALQEEIIKRSTC